MECVVGGRNKNGTRVQLFPAGWPHCQVSVRVDEMPGQVAPLVISKGELQQGHICSAICLVVAFPSQKPQGSWGSVSS